RYSIVDTTLNGGDGDIDSLNMNVPIKVPQNRNHSPMDSAVITGEGIAAIQGCDSTFYYLIITSMKKDSLLGKSIEIYKVTSSGITHHLQYWHPEFFSATGSIVASNDGRLVCVSGLLFEFNRDLGTLKFVKNLQDTSSTGEIKHDIYFSKFSPNNESLYILKRFNLPSGDQYSQLWQYDLETGLNQPSK